MLDRTVAPPFKQIEKISFKKPEKVPVNQGIELYAIHAGTQPVVKLEIIVRAGKWFEKKPGIAFFTGKMIREGTTRFDSFGISRLFESVGGHLEIVPGLDFISIVIYTLEKYLDKLLPVLRSMMEDPSFPESELATFKNIEIQKLRVNYAKNSFLAGRKFRESLFGSDHPYGNLIQESDIESVTREDLITYFKQTIKHNSLIILISGLYGSESIDKVRQTFRDLPVDEHGSVPKHQISSDHPNIYIDKNDSSQSSVRLGCLSIPMAHPDYPKLLVTNEILGGYFGSRLMKNIREEKGLTYGIFSSLVTLKNGTFFTISADVKKEYRDQAFDEILSEIKTIKTEPVNVDELETVRNYMLGQMQADLNTPFALAAKFKNVHLNGLGYEFYSNLVRTIKTIKPEEIIRISSEYLKEDHLVKVYVG